VLCSSENVTLVNVLIFNTRELAGISISAALWALINAIVGPAFWNVTHLPILCDTLSVAALLFAVWFVRKPGALTLVGAVATVLSFALNPAGLQFLGFTVASVVLDLLFVSARAIKVKESGYLWSAVLVTCSFASMAVAGVLIGLFFMSLAVVSGAYGGLAVFAALHGAGGVIGGILGIVIVGGLERRALPLPIHPQ
jgi:hypothetical protein